MPDSVLISFKSTLTDKSTWDGEEIVEPAGREHAELLCAHLATSFRILRKPRNEEDYCWEFLVECNGVTVGVHVGETDDDVWLIDIFPVTLFGFLRRNTRRAAMESVADAVENFLRADDKFAEVSRESGD